MNQLTMFDTPAAIPTPSGISQQFKLLTSTETEEWYTPPWVIALTRQVIGDILIGNEKGASFFGEEGTTSGRMKKMEGFNEQYQHQD